MFLLAILITTSWKDGTRLEALNQHFLKALSIKLIQNGDRELDLLCGLLVYLNWIHLHMAPKTHQAYRLTAIAISMAVDYGITRRPGKGRHQQLNVETFNDLPRGLNVVDTEFWGLEAQRAYLGCYHIATWYSIITRKTIPLAYTEYLHLCAQSLAATQEVPTDSDLIFHLELTREAEKVYTLFNYTETSQAQCMNDEQIQIYLNAFCAKLHDWRSRLPTLLKDDPSQRVWPSLFEAFVREVSLSGMSRSTDMSVFRIRIIMDSLKSTKEFLDTFLAIPLADLISLPSTHWALLGYSILLAATMSLSIQTPGWNIKMARSIIKLDAYIDALSVHIHDLSSRIQVLETAKDWYKSLLTRWAAIKSSYIATLHQTQPEMNTPAAAASSTSAAESQLTQYPAEQRMDIQQEPPQSPAPADIRHEARPLPMSDSFLTSGGGLELFDFTANVGSWMVPDFDFPWLGVAGF
ncbi:c6 zinc finger domain containing protein [Grosmannia clavigera kw1407]|uniref:C6 zinc finger domain containing protein n=1 Tax=Grosmannia clavigera (strain kw1407 / UAMH 11150) TaxID=655863 RepID=F0XHY5_GROCL|nr:c6 zinc finger domain containing protein [Grosmannia clavigera kw1407]EFX02789.1 c6 zinc finger domain containing protein [Grosmannia clavigera kw1407]